MNDSMASRVVWTISVSQKRTTKIWWMIEESKLCCYAIILYLLFRRESRCENRYFFFFVFGVDCRILNCILSVISSLFQTLIQCRWFNTCELRTFALFEERKKKLKPKQKQDNAQNSVFVFQFLFLFLFFPPFFIFLTEKHKYISNACECCLLS